MFSLEILLSVLPFSLLLVTYISSYASLPSFFSPFLPSALLLPADRPGYPSFRIIPSSRVKIVFYLFSLLVPLFTHGYALGLLIAYPSQSSLFFPSLFTFIFYALALVLAVAHLPLVTVNWPLTLSLTLQLLINIHVLLDSKLVKNQSQLWLDVVSIVVALAVQCSLQIQPYSLDKKYLESKRVQKVVDGKVVIIEPEYVREDYVTLWQWATVQWYAPMIRRAVMKGSLDLSDAFPLAPWMSSKEVLLRFSQLDSSITATSSSSSSKDPSAPLWKRLARANAFDLILCISGSLIQVGLQYCVPLFLKWILEELSAPNGDKQVALRYAIYMFVATLIKVELDVNVLWILRRGNMRWRSVVMGMVYEKALKKRDSSGLVKEDEEAEDKKTQEGKGEAAGSRDSKDKDKKKDDKKKEKKKEEMKQADQGKILNLMSSDAESIGNMCHFIVPLVQSPFEFLIGVGFLYNLLGWSAFAGIAFLPAVLVVTKFITTFYQRFVDESNTVKDKRMTGTNELVQSIRQLKWFGWENQFAQKILAVREKELGLFLKMSFLNVGMEVIWGIALPGITYLGFLCYTKVAHKELTIPIAFTALQIFGMLTQPIFMLIQGMLHFIRIYASVKRVESFLKEEEVPDWVSSIADTKPLQSTAVGGSEGEEVGRGKVGPVEPQFKIGFEGANFVYAVEEKKENEVEGDEQPAEGEEQETATATGEQNKGFKLVDLNVEFPQGKLTLVTGASGSGKTSLLLALLGELYLLSGKVFLPKQPTVVDEETGLYNGVAYAAQAPWLQHATVRDNILFGTPYDEKRYEKVIEACALTTDLTLLDEGDLTEIGEKGVSLSGGQKARVALARAVYSRAKTLLLDDTLSAVDTHVGAHIFKAFSSELFKGRTVILVTHAVDLCLPAASFMVTMSEGRIILAENVTQIESVDEAQGELSKVIKQEEDIQEAVEKKLDEDDSIDGAPEGEMKKPSKLIEAESKAEGSISWAVYQSYIHSAGYWMWIIVITAYAVSRGSEILQQVFLKIWGEAYSTQESPILFFVNQAKSVAHTIFDFADVTSNRPWGLPDPRENVNPYLLILLGIDIWIGFIQFIASLSMALLALRASRTIFHTTILKVVGGTFRYFDRTPTGRILNRFSQDFGTLDGELSSWLEFFVINLMGYIRAIVVIVAIVPWFLIITILVLYIYFNLSQMYLACSREFRRLESISKSPIFSQFGETLNGLATIRAYGAERRFNEEIRSKVDAYMKAHNGMWMANRWLLARFDLVGATAVLISVTLVIFGKSSAGSAALVITSAISLSSSTYWVLRSWSDLELNFNAVERIEELKNIPQEPPAILESRRPPAWWPSDKGSIVIEDFKMSYAPDLPLVLKGISATIGSKQKVGIVGRTGSGKSSLTFGLLRCVEPMGGRILIDGIDITSIGTEDLRKQITLIPQEPAIFSGTIRSNLDPFDEHSDEECWDVLRRVQLVSSSRPRSEASSPSSGTSTPTASTSQETLIGSEFVKSRRIDVKSLKDGVSAGGANLSSGQRQLLSLARAMLRASRIVILDEATASVDFDTDLKVQEAIRTDFANSIVLTIAHRLQTVIDYDIIMVMDKGSIVEFDSPEALLKKEGGVFKEMWEKRK